MFKLPDIGQSSKEFFQHSWEGFLMGMKDFFKLTAESLQETSNTFLQEMVEFVLYTPTVASDPIIFKLWTIVRVISFSLIGLMFVWEAFKKVISIDNVITSVEFKTMMIRMIYGLILAVFSLDIIDIMIRFNQALIDTIKINFTFTLDSSITINSTFSFFMTLAMLIVQIVLAIKLILQYWMRIAEIWLMAILSPAVYVLWINPRWGGYLGQWFSRLTSTIGTTFIWSLLFAIYSAMVSLVSSAGVLVGYESLGPVAGMCLSIALLLTMHQTPSFLKGFMSNNSSAIDIMKNTAKDVFSTTAAPFKMAKKAKGWIKKK